MILFENRIDIERHGIHQLLNGMRSEFPLLVPQWLVELERTERWSDLGRQIAKAMTASQVQSTALLKFTTEPTPPALHVPSKESLLRDFAERLERTQAELKRQRERADQAENEARSLRWDRDEQEKRAAIQIAQLTAELTELRRIVGEQQYRLNQTSETTE